MRKQRVTAERFTPVAAFVYVPAQGYCWETVRFPDESVEWLEADMDSWVETIHVDHPGWTPEQSQAFAAEKFAEMEQQTWREALVEVGKPVSLERKIRQSMERMHQGLPARDEEAYRKYDPMQECPTLYLDFSRLSPTKEAILAFANTWGALGFGKTVRRRHSKGSLVPVRGEPLEDWTVEIDAMHETVELLGWLDVAREGVPWAKKQLEERFQWRDGKPYHCRDGQEKALSVLSGLTQPPYVEEGNSILAGWWYVQRAINTRLQNTTGGRTLYHPDTGDFTLNITFSSLRGALWLQCANALTEGKGWRTCANCGRYFEVYPGQKRADAMYCGRACRQQQYYVTKGKARRKSRKSASSGDTA